MSTREQPAEAVLTEGRPPWSPPGAPGEPGPEQPHEALELEEHEYVEPDVSLARSLLTAPLPAGLGEVLVTDIWLPPEPKEPEKQPAHAAAWEDTPERPARAPRGAPLPLAEPPPESDPQRAWETRQELRELGLLRERPVLRYDARVEEYWHAVQEARERAERAIVDPYTDLVTTFAEVRPESIAEHRPRLRQYGHRAEAMIELGRAYVVIGRLKAARGVFRHAARLDPHNWRAWWHLGVACLFSRANAEAAAALEHAADEFPGDLRTEMALGVARYHLKQYERAEYHLRRQAGDRGMRATVRSMLACAMRMQGKWDDARVELGFLRECRGAEWGALANQCLDCVARGEGKRQGPQRARRRKSKMVQALLAALAGAGWAAYAVLEDLFPERAPLAVLPLVGLGLLLLRSLQGISGGELATEFGNAEQGLPCWQTTTWVRPRRPEF